MVRRLQGLWLTLFLTAAPAAAQHSHGSAPVTASGAPPLFDNLGDHHHPITTASPTAQRYFDQGLRLVYAFNHDEAIRAFQEAARLDPTCAMAYWGVALALGPNINVPVDPEQERTAQEAVQKALSLSSRASEVERAYVEALSKRYSAAPGAGRKALDLAYANAMREVSKRYPDDLDAATLFAEALMDLRPWDYWASDGQPQPGTLEILSTLESVMKRNPNHPGANHYYIHALEASSQPERALPCAERLPGLMPGAGHLVHMPAHIYMRMGRYADASESSARAAAVDRDYIEKWNPQGVYPMMSYAHNLYFLWATLCVEGRSAEALRTARDLAAMVPVEIARQGLQMEFFTLTPLFTLARFGRWEEVLKEPRPPSDLQVTTGMWNYARGLALTATGRLDEAGKEANGVAAVATKMSIPLLRIASNVLAGELAARRGQTEDAVRRLQEAIRIQDGLGYRDPPSWYYPVRQSLGAVLLAAGRAAEAEAIYREDLRQNPENGWSLYGLARSLRARKAEQEAAAAEQRFQRAWARADVTLSASRF